MQWEAVILSLLIALVHARNKLIIVGMSGLRHDYTEKSFLPTFHLFRSTGVHANKVTVPMVTNSWPAMWTVATGLWPEEHGIIDDTMYDPTIDEPFTAGVSTISTLWFPYKPIWISAEENGVKTAVSGWPGSDIKHGSTQATDFVPFVSEETEEETRTRIEDLSRWMYDGADLALFMLPEPDNTAHENGADSDQVDNALKQNDRLLTHLLDTLHDQGLNETNINIIIIGDHGMVNHRSTDVAYLSDYNVKLGDLRWITSNLFTTGMLVPHAGLVDSTYEKLKQENATDYFTAYLKEDLPERFHIKNHRRTPPIVIVPNAGYRIEITRPHTDIQMQDKVYGMHGYDSELLDMMPSMLARGPDFNRVDLDSIDSIDIYPLVCSLLDLNTCHGTDAAIEMAQRMVNVPLEDKRAEKLDYYSLNTGARKVVKTTPADADSPATSLSQYNYCIILVTLAALYGILVY